ncbi:hypothetical protein ACFCZY_40065 [Streptomyces sp. NPDC056237]|uniref:hypothetical protein n=1 Tax=Streptomyces sp. NPDC056237 TaxID=3345758 RepID=UPI0035D76CAB
MPFSEFADVGGVEQEQAALVNEQFVVDDDGGCVELAVAVCVAGTTTIGRAAGCETVEAEVERACVLLAFELSAELFRVS